jgi:F-type H+-transporting ATPase subunit alpha
MTEVLKQPQYTPFTLEKEVTVLYAVNNGYFNPIPVEKMAETEKAFHQYMATQAKDVLSEIATTKELSDSTEAKLKAAIEQFVAMTK